MLRTRAVSDAGSPSWSNAATFKKQKKKKLRLLKASSKSGKDTKLLQAVYKGQVRDAAVLLKKGASVRAEDETSQETPLHLACGTKHGQSALLVSMLLQHGAAANGRMGNGQTALHRCARSNNVDALKALLLSAQDSVDMDAEDYEGMTPAKVALTRGHMDAFELIVQHGANVRKTDHTGAPVLHFAASIDCWKAVQFLCQTLPDLNIDFQAPDGSTALHTAAKCGSTAAVASLLGGGAQWKLMDNDGHTAEQVANLNNHDTIASMLHSCDEVGKTLSDEVCKENVSNANALSLSLPPPPRCPSNNTVAGAALPPPLPTSPRAVAPPSLSTPSGPVLSPRGPNSRAQQRRRMMASKAATGIYLPPPPQRRRTKAIQDDVQCGTKHSPARTRRVARSSRARPVSMYIKAPPELPQTANGYGYIPPLPMMPPPRPM